MTTVVNTTFLSGVQLRNPFSCDVTPCHGASYSSRWFLEQSCGFIFAGCSVWEEYCTFQQLKLRRPIRLEIAGPN